MKVYLGKYPSNPFSQYGKLFKVFNFLSNRKRIEYIRIDPQDVWNLDYTLALIIVPALKELKKRKHGSPSVDDSDVSEALRSTSSKISKKNEWDSDEFFFQRWDYVVDEMIWAFEQVLLENSSVVPYDKEKEARANEGRRLFAKYYGALWD